MTKVIFRKFKDNGDVIALFPQLPGTNNYCKDCESYQHIGQHGAFTMPDFGLDEYTSPATEQEYKSLFNELVSIGYDDLKVFKKINYVDYIARKAAVHAT